jgi:plasmid stabilization system protein ParE
MPAYIVAPQADRDIFEIWHYLAVHAGIDVAERIENELYAAFESLAAQPELGHRRADLTSGDVLFFKLYSYLIIYRRLDPVEFVAVLHARRNLPFLLSDRLKEKWACSNSQQSRAVKSMFAMPPQMSFLRPVVRFIGS